MAASDGFAKLADRAKEAENRVASANEKAKEDLEAERESARKVGEQQAEEMRETAHESKEEISEWWADVQRSWDHAVAGVRSDVENRKAEHDLHKAQRRAERTENEAEFAADFAYSAIVQAEYAALDASLARTEAKELETQQAGATT